MSFPWWLLKTKKTTFGLALVVTLLVAVFRKINRPPSHLRHLPYISFYTFFKAIIKDITIDRFSKDIVLPVMKRSPGAFVCSTVGYWGIMLTDPIAIKQFLMKPDMFPKAEINQGQPGTLIHRFVGGANIVMLNGTDWKRHRKIVNPAFNRAMPIRLFGELTQQLFQAMDCTSSVDVLDVVTRMTLDTIGRAGFGFDFNSLADPANEWVTVYNDVKTALMDPFFLVFPVFDTTLVNWFPKRAQKHQQMTRFLAMLDTIIEAKRHHLETVEEEENRDLLTLMIESEQEGQATLTNEELRKNLCIFFFAGQDTTAFTLSFMIYELAVNLALQDRARQEAIEILGDTSSDVLPSAEQTKQMTYINAVIKETMRLHNPVLNTTAREAKESCHLGQVYIPKGALVCADMSDLHRNPLVWHDPYRFDPERFLPGGEAERQPAGSGWTWAPFSNGGRICVGMNFSLAEQRVVLSMLLRKYTWTLPKDSIHRDGLVTNGLAFGIISTSNLKVDFKPRY